MPELTAYIDDVQSLGDQQRGEGVTEIVKTQPGLPALIQPRLGDCRGEATTADVSVVHGRAAEGREHWVTGRAIGRPELVLAHQPRKRGHQDDIAVGLRRLRRGSLP